jgi:hypothetical protein
MRLVWQALSTEQVNPQASPTAASSSPTTSIIPSADSEKRNSGPFGLMRRRNDRRDTSTSRKQDDDGKSIYQEDSEGQGQDGKSKLLQRLSIYQSQLREQLKGGGLMQIARQKVKVLIASIF